MTAALLAAVPQADAQHIRGRLLDLETDAPVVAGVLTLLDGDSSVVARAESDTAGYWRLTAPRPGTYYVAARDFLGTLTVAQSVVSVPARLVLSEVADSDR